jgi:hypothetical protein
MLAKPTCLSPKDVILCDMREADCTRRASDARDQMTCKH